MILRVLNEYNIVFEKKQVGFKTGSKRAVDGGITAAMLKLNGSWRLEMKV
jgi:hypothetical protein